LHFIHEISYSVWQVNVHIFIGKEECTDKEKIKNKFLGKNFVFDHRRSESVSNEIIADCHQCGHKCDTHINCENEACHLLFIQCEKCAKKYNNCCSEECYNIISLSIEDQKKLRKGKKNSNQIFKTIKKMFF